MVAAGDAEGSVCGCVLTSKDVLRSMLHCIGTPPRVRLITSLFVVAVRNRDYGHNGLLGFCDASTVIDPTAAELADMAIAAAQLPRHKLTLDLKPDHVKKDGHQGIIDEMEQVDLKLETPDFQSQRDVPEMMVTLSEGRIGPYQGDHRKDHQQDAPQGIRL